MLIDDFSNVDDCIDEIGSRIRSARIKAHYTQEDLSRLSGVSLNSVARLEQGKTVQLDTFLRVVKVLRLLPRLEVMFPREEISPMQLIKKEKAKVIYRKSSAKKTQWKWG